MNKQLYQQRANEHIAHAKTLSQQGDYVQAGEKIWGALSALVNCKTTINDEIKSVDDKRHYFNRLFTNYTNRVPQYAKMHTLGIDDSNELFDMIFALHKVFYGGNNYSENQCRKYMPFFIEVLENL